MKRADRHVHHEAQADQAFPTEQASHESILNGWGLVPGQRTGERGWSKGKSGIEMSAEGLLMASRERQRPEMVLRSLTLPARL